MILKLLFSKQFTVSGIAVLLLLCIGATLQPAFSQSQEIRVRGKVLSESGEEVPGVTVRVKGSTKGTITDPDGNYSLLVPDGKAVLVFSLIGHAPLEVPVDNRQSLNVTMKNGVTALSETVVVGYGTQNRAKVVGSVASITGEQIAELPVANLATALQGRMPGVNIDQASGKPGANTSLRVRTASTYSGAEDPLYVIDGIILTKQDFDNLDATMVESISVLKDASAAVYGARGANGVVLVKTKMGRVGKPRITYQGSYGTSDATKFPQMMSAYDHASILNSAYQNGDLDPDGPNGKRYYTPDELEHFKTLDHNWIKEIWKPSWLTRHALNITGGTDRVQFFTGGSYYREEGNLDNLYVNKYSLRVGVNAKITNNLTANISLNTDMADQSAPIQDDDQPEEMNETFGTLVSAPRFAPMAINGMPVNMNYPDNNWNPLGLQNSGSYNRSRSRGIILNTSLEYKVPMIEGLTLRLQYGLTERNITTKQYSIPYNVYDFVMAGTNEHIYTDQVSKVHSLDNQNRLLQDANRNGSYQVTGSIAYGRQFGKHNVNALVLWEQAESNGETLRATREGQLIPDVEYMFGWDPNTRDNASSGTEGGRLSYVGRINYDYDSKYLLEAAFRYDASANFAPQNRWGFFPSVAVGWRISQEPFFKDNVTFMDELKLRASAGLLGNDGNMTWQWRQRYTGNIQGALFGENITTGLRSGVIPNPNITWEKTQSYNAGIDARFLDNAISFSVDGFFRHTYDIYFNRGRVLPTITGAQMPNENYGKMNSWGAEFALGYYGSAGKDFQYSIRGQITFARDKVIDIYQSPGDIGTWRDQIGKPRGAIVGYYVDGIIRTQEQLDAILKQYPDFTVFGAPLQLGMLNYRDIRGPRPQGSNEYGPPDGKIDENDQDNIYANGNPKFGFAFTLGASWRGFSFDANFGGAVGGWDLVDEDARMLPTPTQNAPAFWADYWRPDNPNAAYPKPIMENANDDELETDESVTANSTFWARRATTLRCNNMTLGYTLPARLASRLKIPSLKIFATGTNLFTIINNMKFKDPASNVFIDYPMMRSVSFGVTLSL